MKTIVTTCSTILSTQYKNNKSSQTMLNNRVNKFSLKKYCYALLISSTLGICNASDFIHVDMNNKLQRNMFTTEGVSLSALGPEIVSNNQKYLIDFSNIKSATAAADLKKQFYKSSVISFKDDLILISRYKGGLMFTPIADSGNLQQIAKRVNELSTVTSQAQQNVANTNTPAPPSIDVYIDVSRDIQNDCVFPINFTQTPNSKPTGEVANLCDRAHINLIYKVFFARSLQRSGSPDAKIVRISLDDSSSGAGIALNNSGLKNLKISKVPGHDRSITNGCKPGDSAFDHCLQKVYTTNAIAQSYQFSTTASNNLVKIIGAKPDNLNPQYRKTEVVVQTYGVAGKPTVAYSPSGLTLGGGVDVSYSYTHQNWLAFDTQEYEVLASTPTPQQAAFVWQRQQLPNADSLISRRTSSEFERRDVIPWGDLNRISPMSYLNFRPKFDVTYRSITRDTVGQTTFNIDSSVVIKPLYAREVLRWIGIGWWYYYDGFWEQENVTKKITVPQSFDVVWDHPVFTGGWPIALLLSDMTAACPNFAKDGTISMASRCNHHDVKQSLLYDAARRYGSTQEESLCLDATDLTKLAKCNHETFQKWAWKGGHLYNDQNNKVLTYNKQNGKLFLSDSIDTIPNGYSANINTVFAQLFTYKYFKLHNITGANYYSNKSLRVAIKYRFANDQSSEVVYPSTSPGHTAVHPNTNNSLIDSIGLKAELVESNGQVNSSCTVGEFYKYAGEETNWSTTLNIETVPQEQSNLINRGHGDACKYLKAAVSRIS